MGAVELKFSGSFERSSYLKEFSCPYCDKPISDKEHFRKYYNIRIKCQ